MNYKHLFYLFFTWSLTACSTDFDVIDKWKDRTIVFGLLNSNDSIHYVKINKAYLGAGNAYEYAVIRDSSEYSQLTARIEEFNSSGAWVATYNLRDTLLNTREPGLFYYPEQKVYYFKKNNLNEDNSYKLIANVGENGKEIQGQTNIVKQGFFNSAISNPFLAIPFANSNSSQTDIYPNLNIKFNKPENANRCDVYLCLNFIEHTTSGVTGKKVEWRIYSATDLNPSSQTEITLPAYNGKSFYQTISNLVQPNPNVIKRVAKSIDFVLYASHPDLTTYISVNEPSTGIVQEKPLFTNLTTADNTVYGIFSSRKEIRVKAKMINENSMRELCTGQYTGNLGFCSDSSIWVTQPFYCN
jgi:hypothetical protein